MNKTPNSLRKHIGLFGSANAGKSALFNRILNQYAAIVSEKKGTTTDPVLKAMELIGFGPVVFVDTAGLSDGTDLGTLREKKTEEILEKTDYALFVIDFRDFDKRVYEDTLKKFKKYNVPFKIIISKADTLTENDITKAQKEFENPLFTSVNDEKSIEELKNFLIKELNSLPEEERGLLDGISKDGDHIILVCPVDSEAPKGRLILPQVQLIRECLDKGIICHVCTVDTLLKTLKSIENIHLVVTDSQAFKEVDAIVPENIRLTSFSILMARQKGDLSVFNEGLSVIKKLEDGDSILISEVCTHNTSHEDIGRVKIPSLLMKKTGKNLNFEFSSGNSFPEDLGKYKLVIHCGGCMITRKAMCARLGRIKEHNVPTVNFGILLSYLTGAYSRQEWLF